MKKFTRTINSKKYKGEIFEKEDVFKKLNMSKEDWKLIDDYQKTFPQLLINDTDDFVIDGETLCKELNIKSNFTDWLLRHQKGKEGKLLKYRCKENVDYVCISGKSETQRKNGQRGVSVKTIITLKLECAKKIAMRQNNIKGDLVCDYFILMEKTLKDYENWLTARHPGREGYKRMDSHIKEWGLKRGCDVKSKLLYTREIDSINKSLTGLSTRDLRAVQKVFDNQTRNNLDTETNSILAKLQDINISLLIADMDYFIRMKIIDDTCKKEYPHIKEKYLNKNN